MIARFALAVLPFLLFGCAGTGGEVEQPGPGYEESYAAAERALAEAEARRNVWTPTEKLLQASRKAFDEGRVDEAIELATEARLLAELAVQQAETEKEAWRSRVLSH